MILIGLAVGADYGSRYATQSFVASAAKHSTKAKAVSVTVSSFPFLWNVAVNGKVKKVDVVATGVPAGAVQLNKVELVATDVIVNRGDLATGTVKLESVSSATVTITYDLNGIEAALVNRLGVTAVATASQTIEVVDSSGKPIDTINLKKIPIIPDCPLQEAHVGNTYTFTCTVAPVPASVLAGLSKG